MQPPRPREPLHPTHPHPPPKNRRPSQTIQPPPPIQRSQRTTTSASPRISSNPMSVFAIELDDRAVSFAREGAVLTTAPSTVFDGESAGANAWRELRSRPMATSSRHLGAILTQRNVNCPHRSAGHGRVASAARRTAVPGRRARLVHSPCESGSGGLGSDVRHRSPRRAPC